MGHEHSIVCRMYAGDVAQLLDVEVEHVYETRWGIGEQLSAWAVEGEGRNRRWCRDDTRLRNLKEHRRKMSRAAELRPVIQNGISGSQRTLIGEIRSLEREGYL